MGKLHDMLPEEPDCSLWCAYCTLYDKMDGFDRMRKAAAGTEWENEVEDVFLEAARDPLASIAWTNAGYIDVFEEAATGLGGEPDVEALTEVAKAFEQSIDKVNASIDAAVYELARSFGIDESASKLREAAESIVSLGKAV